MKKFFKKYFKFNTTNANIVICAIAIVLNICVGDYWEICGWLSAFCAWFLVASIENWNDELLNERFELEHKLTDLNNKNVKLDCDNIHNEKFIKLLKQSSSDEIARLTNDVLKMQEENERLQKLLNEIKNK